MSGSLEIPGYREVEAIFRSARTLVHQGIRIDGELPVVLKSVTPGSPDTHARWRLQHEWQILSGLNLPGVVQATRLLATPLGLTLELRRHGSGSLKSLAGALVPLKRFLEIAGRLAQAVAALHAQGITHRDINPSNIVQHAGSGEVWLIDFGLATKLTRESTEVQGTRGLEGTLGYLSPEQTGRMNRSVDHRSDLYSLGVTLFELLCGRPPFRSRDPLELLHATVALQPPSARSLRADVPQALSDLLARLLAKDAEDRYQSALSLTADLETCGHMLGTRGRIPAFELGSGDRRGHFLLPERLYGREEAIATLEDALIRCRGGEAVAIGVRGAPGAGKTALVRELLPRLAGQGSLANGKCDPLRRSPYAPVVQALRSLANTVLSESEAEIKAWRRRYDEAAEGQGALLIELLPEASRLLGAQPELPELAGPEARERLLSFLERILRAFHRPEAPLALFLDDLQWSDGASLDLIERLLNSRQHDAPLLLLAWRDDEVGPDHPLTLVLNELAAREKEELGESVFIVLEAGQLGAEAVSSLVTDALECSLEEAEILAGLIHEKTDGNAFFVRQFLLSLHESGVLSFDAGAGRWTWSIDEVVNQSLTSNVVELLTQRMGELSVQVREIISAAACIAGTFSLDVLASSTTHSLSHLCRALMGAVAAGLLLPLGDGWSRVQSLAEGDAQVEVELVQGETFLRFAHDAIQEAAYQRLDASERDAAHLRLGRMLLERWSEDESADPFLVADQLNLVLDALDDPAQRLVAARCELAAGEAAIRSAAFESALDYLGAGVGLLSDEAWKVERVLAFTLHRKAAECMLMCPARAEGSLDYQAIALARAQGVLECVAIQRIKIREHSARHEFDDAIRRTLEALRWVGVSLPQEANMVHVAAAFLKTKWMVRGLDLEGMRALPESQDPKVHAAMELLVEVTSTTYYARPMLLPLVLLKIVALTVRHGVSAPSAYGFVGYGFLQIVTSDDVDGAVPWGEFARELVQRFDARHLHAKIEVVWWGFIQSRRRPVAEIGEEIFKAQPAAREAGDAEYAALCSFNHTYMAFHGGVELNEMARRSAADVAVCDELHQERTANTIIIIQQTIANLRGEVEDPSVLRGEFMDVDEMRARMHEGGDISGPASLAILENRLRFLFGSAQDAVDAADVAGSLLKGLAGAPELSPFHFVAALSRLCVAREWGGGSAVGRKQIKKARKHLKRLRVWAKHNPVNEAHRVKLVEAEFAQLCGDSNLASQFYDEAVELSRASGMIHDEALCTELAARDELRRGRMRGAAIRLAEARSAWLSYGCTARIPVLAQLEAQTGGVYLPPDVALKRSHATTSSTRSTSTSSSSDTKAYDLLSVIKAARAVSSEIRLTELLRTLIGVILENAGADAGQLLLAQDGKLEVVARASSADEVRAEVLEPPLLLEAAGLDASAMAVIRYVARSREAVIVQNTEKDERFFSANVGEAGPRSVLCVPAIKGRSLIGVVYLENHLTTAAFTSDRHEVVGALCSQAAISIENAKLYSDLKLSLERQTELTQAYGRFMPPQFLALLEKESVTDLELGDQVKRQVTVLFSDIRGFTRIAETIGPDKTFAFINRYLGHMEPAIHANGGFVNQYLGDGIMALFPGSAQDAMRAALSMLRGLKELNMQLRAEGVAPVSIGIGLNTGPLMIGAIGGIDRRGRGIVGDVTNVAARLEGMTKRYAVPLLVGEGTVAALEDSQSYALREIDRVCPVGREHALCVYEVLDAAPALERAAKVRAQRDFAAGLSQWRAGEFQAAAGSFEHCLKTCPEDAPAKLQLERCLARIGEPVPENWDGTVRLKFK